MKPEKLQKNLIFCAKLSNTNQFLHLSLSGRTKITTFGQMCNQNVKNTEKCYNVMNKCIESDDIELSRTFKYALCNFSFNAFGNKKS